MSKKIITPLGRDYIPDSGGTRREKTPEQRLFLAVICHSLITAIETKNFSYFTTANHDFLKICALADENPITLLKKIDKVAKSDLNHRVRKYTATAKITPTDFAELIECELMQ